MLAVILLSITFSGSPEADAHQPFGIGLVGKSEKVDKARLFLQTREHIVRHRGADLHTLAILVLDIPERERT